VLQNGDWNDTIPWRSLKVGDIVRVEQDQFFPVKTNIQSINQSTINQSTINNTNSNINSNNNNKQQIK
jgi:magnesium-transporting ATPase (P-type)